MNVFTALFLSPVRQAEAFIGNVSESDLFRVVVKSLPPADKSPIELATDTYELSAQRVSYPNAQAGNLGNPVFKPAHRSGTCKDDDALIGRFKRFALEDLTWRPVMDLPTGDAPRK